MMDVALNFGLTVIGKYITSGKKILAYRLPVRSVADCTCNSHQYLGGFHHCDGCSIQAVGPLHRAIGLTEVLPHPMSGL